MKQNAPLQIQCITLLSCSAKKRGRWGKGQEEMVDCINMAKEWSKDNSKVLYAYMNRVERGNKCIEFLVKEKKKPISLHLQPMCRFWYVSTSMCL